MNAMEIIEEAKSICKPNDGIKALVKKDYCIMDEEYCHYPYKDEDRCPDYRRCECNSFMLACLATRTPDQLAPWAIETYSTAMTRDI
jgi:hypothetical protein